MAAATQPAVEEDKSTESKDYLPGPRRKKKDYAVFALSEDFDPEILVQIEGYLKKQFPNLSLLHPRNISEVTRIFNRQIHLLIIDDKFGGIKENLNLVKQLKIKKSSERIPVIFLTENPNELIQLYNVTLLPFQEVDTYLAYRHKSSAEIYSRIHNALKGVQARRSRRFHVDIPIKFMSIGEKLEQVAQLIDLSLHGGVIYSQEPGLLFREGRQLKIIIPKGKYLSYGQGEFLAMAAKIRRVYMGGNKAAISWEYMNESQSVSLMGYLTSYVNQHVKK